MVKSHPSAKREADWLNYDLKHLCDYEPLSKLTPPLFSYFRPTPHVTERRTLNQEMRRGLQHIEVECWNTGTDP